MQPAPPNFATIATGATGHIMFRISTASTLFALALFSGVALASDEVTECDRQAAHKLDPERMTTGVAINDVIPRRAISACEEAIAAHPDEPRFHYQLGRAFTAANRDPEAVAAFEKAALAGYPMAAYNLGIMAKERGEYDKAIEYQQAALAAGIDGAQQELDGLIFTGEGFSNPAFFDAIYHGRLSGAGNAVLYASAFLNLFNNTPGCQKVATNGITVRAAQAAQGAAFGQMFNAMRNAERDGTFEGAASGGYKAGQDLAAGFAMQVGSVQDDANLFYTRYDCNTPIAVQFFDHLGDWVLDLD